MSSLSQNVEPNLCEPGPSNPNASLDKLPTELKISILKAVPDISTLCTLFNASPLYYQAYMSQRRLILSSILSNLPPSIATESLAVLQISRIPSGTESKCKEAVEKFATQYKQQQQVMIAQTLINLDLEDVVAMATLHLLIERMTQRFCDSRCALNPITCEAEPTYERLSASETIRIQRAFYRLELFSRTFQFDWRHWPLLYLLHGDPRTYPLFSNYTPWEKEEIGCVVEFMSDMYEVITDQCADTILEFCDHTEDFSEVSLSTCYSNADLTLNDRRFSFPFSS
jgi:hypothetical protein